MNQRTNAINLDTQWNKVIKLFGLYRTEPACGYSPTFGLYIIS